MKYWNIAVAIFPSRQSVFPSELQSQSPQLGLYRSVYPLGAIRVRIGPPQEAQYGKILGLLSRGGPNTKKYSLVEVIENDCIVTRVGVYDEISPEPSGNPSGSGDISLYTPPLVTIQLQYCQMVVNTNLELLHKSRNNSHASKEHSFRTGTS